MRVYSPNKQRLWEESPYEFLYRGKRETKLPNRMARRLTRKMKLATKKARKHGARGSFEVAHLYEKFVAYDQRCYYCGQYINLFTQEEQRMSLDHFIPLSQGGDNTIHNVVPACMTCNQLKRASMPWEFKTGEGQKPLNPIQWRLRMNLPLPPEVLEYVELGLI